MYELILAIVGGFLGGGIGLRVLDRVLSNKDKKQSNDSDLEKQYIAATSELRRELFNEIDKLKKEVDTWRERYGTLYIESQDLKDVNRNLRRDYEELKMAHGALLKNYGELKLVHDEILTKYEFMKKEMARFENRVLAEIGAEPNL